MELAAMGWDYRSDAVAAASLRETQTAGGTYPLRRWRRGCGGQRKQTARRNKSACATAAKIVMTFR